MSASPTANQGWANVLYAAATPLPSSPTLRCVVGPVGEVTAVSVGWEFSNHGGSFGEADAEAFVAAVAHAVNHELPLVTLVRTGGTRLPEGMHALVGIPRTTLALQRLRQAGLAHVSVADSPTMGGVWVSVASRADVRIAVEGALIGFSGPRAVRAMTGRDLAAGSNTAAAMYDAGLVDAVAPPAGVVSLLGRTLAALAADEPDLMPEIVEDRPASRDGWEQVVASRTEERPDGVTLLDRLVSGGVPLHAADATVAARLGRLAGRRIVVVALAGSRSTMPSRAGFDLLARAAKLAGALGLALVVLVDTPGADPHTESAGLSPAIADAMSVVLSTPAPTLCLVHGEGGSGGALAGAVTDVVGVGPYGWFAALAPEGAAATLRTDADIVARMMHVTPDDLLRNGFADAFVPAGAEAAWAASTIDRLRAQPPVERLQQRHDRWSRSLGASRHGDQAR